MPLVQGEITQRGAIIPVSIGLSRAKERAFRRVGFKVPSPIVVEALIDTGAEISGISREIVTQLGLHPTGQTKLLSPTTRADEPQAVDLYDVSLALAASDRPFVVPFVRMIATDCFRSYERARVLFGLDLLLSCVFEFSGPHRSFHLAFPD